LYLGANEPGKTHKLTQARVRAHTHTPIHKYVTLTAFPQQKWFRERASILRYTYIACLVQIYRYKFSSLYEAGVWNVTLVSVRIGAVVEVLM
jgi:hypothetical protein